MANVSKDEIVSSTLSYTRRVCLLKEPFRKRQTVLAKVNKLYLLLLTALSCKKCLTKNSFLSSVAVFSLISDPSLMC